jgi:hypothetical protein
MTSLGQGTQKPKLLKTGKGYHQDLPLICASLSIEPIEREGMGTAAKLGVMRLWPLSGKDGWLAGNAVRSKGRG